MILIEKIFVDEKEVSFYDGIDFDRIMNHPKDGSKGFIFCFISSWIEEVKSYERQNKLNSILKNKNNRKFKSEDIENNYVAIYQLVGTEIEVLFNIVKEKVLNRNFPEHPWLPISGLSVGAWKIVKSTISN